MRAISLWQPWASLWLSDLKLHETRHWPTKYRGPLLVHAAKKIVFDLDITLNEIVEDEFGPHWGIELTRGAIIGEVELVDCISTNYFPAAYSITDDAICGNFEPDRFAWRRGKFTKFVNPIPYKGRQQFFDVKITGEMRDAERGRAAGGRG